MRLLVLSDLHLSGKNNKDKVSKLVGVIEAFKGNAIILNGDIVDLWHTSKLVDVIRANKPFFEALKKHRKVVWIEGNHDENITSLASLNNIKIVPSYSIKYKGKGYIFVHGDKFDPKIIKYYGLARVYNCVAGWIDRNLNTNISKWFTIQFDKFIQKGMYNTSDELAISTLIKNYCSEYDYIVVGHYHKPEIRNFLIDNKPIVYANSGDWVTHNSYLIIEDGNVSLLS